MLDFLLGLYMNFFVQKTVVVQTTTTKIEAVETSPPVVRKPYVSQPSQSVLEAKAKVDPYVHKFFGSQFDAASELIDRESDWGWWKVNSIGAGGIPQAYPYQKMGCGLTEADIECQVKWMKKYIDENYQGSVALALAKHDRINSY